MKTLFFKFLYWLLLSKKESRIEPFLIKELHEILKQKQYVQCKDHWIKGFVSIQVHSNFGQVSEIIIGHDFNKKRQTITEHIKVSFFIAEEYFQNI